MSLLAALVGLMAVTAWAYGGITLGLLRTLQGDKDYSAGQLVPLVAAFLMWRDRTMLAKCKLRPCWRGGIALVLFAQMLRAYGYFFMVWSAMYYAPVLMLAGLVLMVAGLQVFRRVFWIMLFLCLMVPLPPGVHNMISSPLQKLATDGSVFLLEAFGIQVSQQGNIVVLNENTLITVAEACSGLRMLMAFIIVAAFIAYMVKRPRWQKVILLASSIAIAVMCNIIRIFATALLMLLVSTEVGERFFHDFAGLAMMPAAVLLLFGELWLIDKIVVPDAEPQKNRLVVRAKSVRSVPSTESRK